MPAQTTTPRRRRGKILPKHTPDGTVLTTGQVADLCGVAARTVAKWFDGGKLPGWRVPESVDRRVYAHHLRAFLLARGCPVPADLGPMCGGVRVVVYACEARAARLIRDAAPLGAAVSYPADEAALATVVGRPRTAGVVCVGSGVSMADAARVIAKLRAAGWACLHVYGPDQALAPGATAGMPDDAAAVPPDVLAVLAAAGANP
jgi:hypothetical protein